VRKLLSIGQFSQLTRISVSALRFYGDAGVLLPTLIDPDNGYRYYSLAQVAQAEQLSALRSVDLPLEAIATILDPKSNSETVSSILENHEQRLYQRLQTQREALHTVRQLLRGKRQLPPLAIGTRIWPAQTILSLRANAGANDYWQVRTTARQELQHLLNQHGLASSTEAFERYHHHEFFGEPLEIEFCLPIAEVIAGFIKVSGRISISNIAQHQVICAIHPGNWRSFGQSYAALIEWSEQKGQAISGAAYMLMLTNGQTELGFIVSEAATLNTSANLMEQNIWNKMQENTLNNNLANLNHPDKNQRNQAAIDLGSEPDRTGLAGLLAQLAIEPDFFVRETLIWAIVRHGQPAVAALIALLGNPYPQARLLAAQALGKLAAAEALPALIKATEDNDLEVVRRVVYSLGQIADASAIPRLLELLDGQNSQLDSTIITALEQVGKNNMALLLPALTHPSQRIRQHIMEVLGSLADPAAVPALQAQYDDPNWQQRFAAITTLGHIGRPEAEAAIALARNDEDPRVRALVRRLLGG
jgi:HEAT repeat protein/DNA-binding transcriptional MerR regulator